MRPEDSDEMVKRELRARGRTTAREKKKYFFFRALPLVFKLMAFVTGLISMSAGVIVFVESADNKMDFPGLWGLIMIAHGVLLFFMFMGLSEWAHVAMETHLNTVRLSDQAGLVSRAGRGR